MTKEQKIYYMAEMVGNLAIIAPPLREGFWDKFNEQQIGVIQDDIFNNALADIRAILNLEKNPEILANNLYIYKLIVNFSAVGEAKNEMKKFFIDYIDYIYKYINNDDNSMQTPFGEAVPFDNIAKNSDLTFDQMQSKAKQMQEEHSAKLKTQFKMTGV